MIHQNERLLDGHFYFFEKQYTNYHVLPTAFKIVIEKIEKTNIILNTCGVKWLLIQFMEYMEV